MQATVKYRASRVWPDHTSIVRVSVGSSSNLRRRTGALCASSAFRSAPCKEQRALRSNGRQLCGVVGEPRVRYGYGEPTLILSEKFGRAGFAALAGARGIEAFKGVSEEHYQHQRIRQLGPGSDREFLFSNRGRTVFGEDGGPADGHRGGRLRSRGRYRRFEARARQRGVHSDGKGYCRPGGALTSSAVCWYACASSPRIWATSTSSRRMVGASVS